MRKSFALLHLADAQVLRLLAVTSDLKVVYRDWQEKLFLLTFNDLVGFEAFGVEGEDISHGTESTDDPFIEKAVEYARDSAEGVNSYVIWSASSDHPILRVAARNFEVTPWPGDSDLHTGLDARLP